MASLISSLEPRAPMLNGVARRNRVSIPVSENPASLAAPPLRLAIMRTQLRPTTDVKKPHTAAYIRSDTQDAKPDCPFVGNEPTIVV